MDLCIPTYMNLLVSGGLKMTCLSTNIVISLAGISVIGSDFSHIVYKCQVATFSAKAVEMNGM